VIPRLEADGHTVAVTSRRKDVTLELLDAVGLEHRCLSTARPSLPGLALEMVLRVARLCREIRRFRPHVLLARDGAYACQAGWLMRVPAISFDDTDDARLQQRVYAPLAWRIYTDRAYRRRLGTRHRLYRGVSSLAYLAPAVFTPDPGIIRELGLGADVRLILCRLVSWTASHDMGHRGLDRAHLTALLAELSRQGRVLVTSEAPLGPELEPYRIGLPPHRLHHLMAHCSLYVGESATVAAECAVLGVPAVHVSTRRLWYTDELEQYGLVHNVDSVEGCARRALAILADERSPSRYAELRSRYLEASDDLVEVVRQALAEVPRRGLSSAGSAVACSSERVEDPGEASGGRRHRPD
jgi:predicted glycosyltransferase